MKETDFRELEALQDKLEKANKTDRHEDYAAMYRAIYGMPLYDFGNNTENFRSKIQAVRATMDTYPKPGSPEHQARKIAISEAVQCLDETLSVYRSLDAQENDTN